jgi:hypothetical protein
MTQQQRQWDKLSILHESLPGTVIAFWEASEFFGEQMVQGHYRRNSAAILTAKAVLIPRMGAAAGESA